LWKVGVAVSVAAVTVVRRHGGVVIPYDGVVA